MLPLGAFCVLVGMPPYPEWYGPTGVLINGGLLVMGVLALLWALAVGALLGLGIYARECLVFWDRVEVKPLLGRRRSLAPEEIRRAEVHRGGTVFLYPRARPRWRPLIVPVGRRRVEEFRRALQRIGVPVEESR